MSAHPVSGSRRLRTAEAAARLGVKPATLYAYVSRGLLSRERGPGGSTFDAQEVERLAQSSRRAALLPRAQRPLAFVTELTLIEDGRLYFRGRDAVELSGTARFEEVAEWLWSGAWPVTPPPWSVPAGQRAVVHRVLDALPAGATTLDRLTVAVAAAATGDPLRHDRSPTAVAGVGRRLIGLLSEDLAGRLGSGSDEMPVAARVLGGLSPLPPTPARVDALDAALVLLADHEMAASTLAARVAAAFGADPYAVVGAGLGAAGGARHAGASIEVEALLADAGRVGAAVAVGERLRRGQRLPGLGMALYPSGDPRGAALLARVRETGCDPARLEVVDAVLAAMGTEVPPPNVDFGLGALSYVLEMPGGSGEVLFVLARIAGWIAHAGEEYAGGSTFRVRASYAGERPSSG